MNKKLIIVAIVAVVSILLFGKGSSEAACSFTTVGTTMSLDADCTTDATILVPDGFTLDGEGNAITAVDPVAGHFVGGVVRHGGQELNVDQMFGVCEDHDALW